MSAPIPDPRPLLTRAFRQTEDYIRAADPDRLDDPTPCTEYSVRQLLSHLTGALNRIAHVGRGGSAFEVEARVDGVPDGGWAVAFALAAAGAGEAWADDARLDAPAVVPWGTVPGRIALAGYLQETLVHGWDLAVATGQPFEGDPELALFVEPFAARALPAQPRGGEVPFGPVVPVAADAGPYTRLAGWLGRREAATVAPASAVPVLSAAAAAPVATQ